MAASVWPLVHAERAALAADLDDLSAGVTLKATDTDWTHGSGPLVEGPAISLLMVSTGRTAHLSDLTGPGVEVLAAR